jgi:hypothetical protein
MAGDDIDKGTTAQSWPADDFTEARVEIEAETEEGKETATEMMANSTYHRSTWFGLQFGGWFRRDGSSGRYERIGRV